jgi:hypothetical protein
MINWGVRKFSYPLRLYPHDWKSLNFLKSYFKSTTAILIGEPVCCQFKMMKSAGCVMNPSLKLIYGLKFVREFE